jgi:D-alanine-D-alanine ligase
MAEAVILFGGASSERLVSVASAQNLAAHLPDAELWFWHPNGAVTKTSAVALLEHQGPFEHAFTPRESPSASSLVAALDAAQPNQVFVLSLHGGAGEDGTVQRLLEERRLAFTGSDSTASARAFNKHLTKHMVAPLGLRLAFAQVIVPAPPNELAMRLQDLFTRSPRWVLKPVADGSSVGLVHLTSPAGIEQAVATLSRLSVPYLAEEFVTGRELTVGVVEELEGPVALPVSEVRTVPGGAFDYAGKYLGQGTEELTPAPITEAEREQAQHVGLVAHRAVGCMGYSRTDMILTPQGPVFLEINTLPGLTRASFLPQQLAAAGKNMRTFLETQIALAKRRRDVREPKRPLASV